MSEELATKLVEKAKPSFSVPFVTRTHKRLDRVKKGDDFVTRIKGVEYDPETKGTKIVTEKVNFAEEVQACRELCGMTYVKKQLATGAIQPEDLYDDGKSGMDLSKLPADRHIAAKEADKLSKSIGDLCKELGLDASDKVTQEKLEKMLTDEVTKRYNAELAAKAAEGEIK